MLLTDPTPVLHRTIELGRTSTWIRELQIQVVAVDGTSATNMAYIGDVEIRGNPPFDEKPTISDVSVTPTSLPVPVAGEPLDEASDLAASRRRTPRSPSRA